MSLLLIVPFGLILLAIALFPLVVPHWWERNANKALVALILGIPVASYLLLQGETGWHRVQHTLLEYVEFMVLLGSLYTISGGIALRGDLQATPASVKQIVKLDSDGRNKLSLLSTVLPIVIGIVGAAALIAGILLARRPREEVALASPEPAADAPAADDTAPAVGLIPGLDSGQAEQAEKEPAE